jgi:anti-sigma factor RsiW
MKCNLVREDITPWLRGRLSEERAAQVAQHCAACAECQAVAEEERALLKLFDAVPQPPACRDVWPDLFERISKQDRRHAWLGRRWAFSGALATAAACLALVFVLRPGMENKTVRNESGVDERRIVRMVADMQTLPEPETSDLWLRSSVASAGHFAGSEE